MISRSKTTNQSADNTQPPRWLQNASMIATIAIALVAVIGSLIATIHFTIRVDVTPSLIRLEDRQTLMIERFNTIEQRIDGIDGRLDKIEALLTKR